MSYVCTCGHAEDEHERGKWCEVEGCGCVSYEDDPEAE